MWCSVPRTRTLNWQTAMKRLLSRVAKSAKRTVWAMLAALTVFADAGVLQQELGQVLVVLQQTGARKACGELLDNFLDLIVFKPGVDDLEPLAQHRQHHDLGETLPDGWRPGVCFMSVRSMTSQPKPASWSSRGFSTWLRSSRRKYSRDCEGAGMFVFCGSDRRFAVHPASWRSLPRSFWWCIPGTGSYSQPSHNSIGVSVC